MHFNYRVFALLLAGVICSSVIYAQGVDQKPDTGSIQNYQPQPVHGRLDLKERDQYTVVGRNYFSVEDKFKAGHRKVVSGALQTAFGGAILPVSSGLIFAGFLWKEFAYSPYPTQVDYVQSRYGNSLIVLGSLGFAAGLVMCITGPIAIHKGKKMEREARTGDLSFFPTVAPNINSGSKASMNAGVGLKFRF